MILPSATDIARRHLVVSGKVQGVGYRASMVAAARELGLTGWVRNRSDGTVEAVVVGASEPVAALIGWARKGPPSARVSQVTVELSDADGFGSFEAAATL